MSEKVVYSYTLLKSRHSLIWLLRSPEMLWSEISNPKKYIKVYEPINLCLYTHFDNTRTFFHILLIISIIHFLAPSII